MALAGAVLGTGAQLQQAHLWEPWLYAVLALAGLVLLLALHGRRLAWLVLVAATAFAAVGLRAQAYQASALAPALEARDLRMVGVISAMPQRNEAGQRLRFRVESASVDGAPVEVPPQVQLGWYHGPFAGAPVELQRQAPDLVPGDRWAWTVRLRAPHGHANPGGFDYELWLWEQGVQATGSIRAGPRDAAPVRLGATWRHPVERARHAVRDAIHARIADRRIAGILAALAVGDQSGIDRADWDVFRATGVAHLMSISGLHVTMFAWAAAALVGARWRRSTRLCLAWPAQHAAILGGLALAAGYALFSGWGVPAQRTVWMLAAVTLLRLSGRQWPWPAVWLLACAVVVLLDPWALTQPGFWLSFVAVGVLFATDPGVRQRRLVALLREQWVVTLALAPLSLLLFGQVSVVGLAANLLAIPWVTIVVTPLALAGVVLPWAWDAAAAAVDGLALALGWMAAIPYASYFGAVPPLWAGMAGVAGGLLLAMRLPVHLRLAGAALLLPAVLWEAPRPPFGDVEVTALDVGQGSAVIVRTHGKTLVYDAGPRYGTDSDAGHRVVVPQLRRQADAVAMVVISHRDTDHIGGATAVLAMQPDAQLLGSLELGHPLASGRAFTPCVAGARWTWDGISFEVLHPPAGFAASRANAASCVLRVASPHGAALLTGDITEAQEAALAASDAPLQAQFLLVPHHGSKTSSSTRLLQAVRPAVGVVQAGYRNRFGHPAPVVVERLRAHGVYVVETARCGAAVWRASQPGAVACERARAPRYWQHRVP